MTSAAHTPGPWFPIDNGSYWEICTENRQLAPSIASIFENEPLGNNAEADAAFIARACNAYDDMLRTLQMLAAALCNDSRGKSIVGDTVEYHLNGQAMYIALNAARDAIAKAKSEILPHQPSGAPAIEPPAPKPGRSDDPYQPATDEDWKQL